MGFRKIAKVGCLSLIGLIIVSAALSPKKKAGDMGGGDIGGSASVAAPSEKVQASDAPAKPDKPDLEVTGLKSRNEGMLGFVTGKVKNNTDHKYSYAQVEINLLDKEGNIVGSTMANVNNLDAGKTWAFKAMVTEKSAAKFEVKDVTGF